MNLLFGRNKINVENRITYIMCY